MQTVTPQAVANTFLELAHNSNREITPLQAQKLVFLAHGWSLGLRQHALINEPIEAWDHGPVIRSLYSDFKHYGNTAIKEPAAIFVTASAEFNTPVIKDKETKEFVTKVWGRYKNLNGLQLSKLTHLSGTPWKNTQKNSRIPDSLIAAYYKEQSTAGANCKV